MANMGKTHRGDEKVTDILGCEDCAEVVCSKEYYTDDDRSPCPECGGRLLDVQESFDKILQLKRQLEDLGYDDET